MEVPGRIYQDINFDVAGFEGCYVEALLGLVDALNPDTLPILVNLKATKHSWQRFFIDAGIGFWEDWGHLIDDTDEESRFVDYAALYQLKGQSISSIQCQQAIFTITFESGVKLVLKSIDDSIDSDTEIQILLNEHDKV